MISEATDGRDATCEFPGSVDVVKTCTGVGVDDQGIVWTVRFERDVHGYRRTDKLQALDINIVLLYTMFSPVYRTDG